MEYADRHGLEGEHADVFVAVVEAMDAGAMKWWRAEAERKAKA